MDWSQTSTGRKWDHSAPDGDAVCWEDVAHALSNTCRFGGHTRTFYSVAEHCVRVHDWLRSEGASKRVAFYGLLHDAHEAYIGDIPTPLANQIGPEHIAALKDRTDRAIFAKAGLAFPLDDHSRTWVKRADLIFLMSERDHLLGPSPEPWGGDLELAPRVELDRRPGWFPQAAKRHWLLRAREHGLDVSIPGEAHRV